MTPHVFHHPWHIYLMDFYPFFSSSKDFTFDFSMSHCYTRYRSDHGGVGALQVVVQERRSFKSEISGPGTEVLGSVQRGGLHRSAHDGYKKCDKTGVGAICREL